MTENGIATDDDALRREFIIRHLAALGESVSPGINVIGYLYWSLLDNFEWTAGTTVRFGLAQTNYRTQERTVRPSAEEFVRVGKSNVLSR